MGRPDDLILLWAAAATAPDTSVVEVTGLRDGQSPWLLQFDQPHAPEVVLRLGSSDDSAGFATEMAALEIASRHGVRVPRVLAADLSGMIHPGSIAILTTRVPGTSHVTGEPSIQRLRAMGAALAEIHRAPVPDPTDLPRRTRSISSVDFAELRRAAPPQPLLVAAEQVLATRPMPAAFDVFVHGDYWFGNTMWDGDVLTGVIDWDCAGIGHPGIDIGSMRCDAAICAGAMAADEALVGYAQAAGRPVDDVAYWDVVAALTTPPTMEWFVEAIRGQGRTDLDQPTLLARRDDFLVTALARL
jgi:aminoglycoside phosphotransferase (APT) family kinase protein